jgi:hypothetical protein
MLKGFASAGLCLTLVLVYFSPAGAQSFAGVLTQHNDNGRTGQNLSETILTPRNVNSATFGKVFSYSVDGQIYSQPLYVPNVSIPGQGTHNVIYVETQNDSLYAFDADGLSATPLWQVSFINPSAGIMPVPCSTDGHSDISCGVYPIYGINSTPVIDPLTNTMYLVARTHNKGKFFQTLHAIDITIGAEKFGGPVSIKGSVPGAGAGSKNGIVYFDPLRDVQRSGLLLQHAYAKLDGTVYIAWAGALHGWIMAYNALTLKQTAIFNTTPNAALGGIWASGNGIAADDSGSIYVAIGDALFDASASGSDYGDSLVRLDAGLNVLDYFTPNDESCRQLNDLDLGSGGPMILPTQPGNVPNELLIAGKGGTPCDFNPVASRMYLLNRSDLGKYDAAHNQDVEEVIGAPGGYWSSPAYWNGESAAYVYSSGGPGQQNNQGDFLKMYSVVDGLVSTTPIAQSTNIFPTGATPSISANGTADGIVWAVERQSLDAQPGTAPAILYAYDATNVTTALYNSGSAISQGVSRDRGGCANKFAVPTIANGRVYVGTENELDVYGLLGSLNGPNVYLKNPCWAFPSSTVGAPVKEPLTLINNGNATLTVSNIAITGTNAADFTQIHTCKSLKPGAKCVINVTFIASALGPETAYATISDNAVGSPHNIYLVGVGSLPPTTTSLFSSRNPSSFGQAVTLSATVSAKSKGTPTGTVSFHDGLKKLGNANLNPSGLATMTTSTLTTGTRHIVAIYNGDANFAPSNSHVLYQVVQGALVVLSPIGLDFGNQLVGNTSNPQNVMLLNGGNVNLTIASIQISGKTRGDFAETNHCPSSVPPNGG